MGQKIHLFSILFKLVPKTDACQRKPCYNGGTCTLQGDYAYFCTCPTGFSGSNCQTKGKRFISLKAFQHEDDSFRDSTHCFSRLILSSHNKTYKLR